MKPSTFRALQLLREHESCTTHDLIVAGVGSRYSARIHELRHKHGFVITEERLKGDVSGSRYRLVAEPETPTNRGNGNDDRGGPRDARRAVSTKSGPALGADLTQQGTDGAGQVPGRQHGLIRDPATGAAPPSASRAGGVPCGLLFDPDAYGERAA